MAIIVTGATGAFGRAAAQLLLQKVKPPELILTTRKPEQLAEFAALGVTVRKADFDSRNAGRCLRRWREDAADQHGARRLARRTARQCRGGGEAGWRPAHRVHVDHERRPARQSGDRETRSPGHRGDHREIWPRLDFPRDSQYSEAIAMAVAPPALAAGRLPDNAHDGPIAFVSRDDCVASAVGALTTPGHEYKAYDITGPELLSFPKAVALIEELSGKKIDYRRVSDEEMFAYFDSLGVPRHASDRALEGADPLVERRHGDLRPVDSRRLLQFCFGQRPAAHRPQAAQLAFGARAVPAHLAEVGGLIAMQKAVSRWRWSPWFSRQPAATAKRRRRARRAGAGGRCPHRARDTEPQNWLVHGGNQQAHRYSAASTRSTSDEHRRLKPAWFAGVRHLPRPGSDADRRRRGDLCHHRLEQGLRRRRQDRQAAVVLRSQGARARPRPRTAATSSTAAQPSTTARSTSAPTTAG